MSFWHDIVIHNRAHLESWLSEQFEFLLQLASVAIAYALFSALRVLTGDGWLVEYLEKFDQCAALLVFVAFLFRTVRRAITPEVKRNARR